MSSQKLCQIVPSEKQGLENAKRCLISNVFACQPANCCNSQISICVQTTTQTCVQICADLRTVNGTTTGYFCTHNSSFLYARSYYKRSPPLCSMLGLPGPAAIPGSVLALASPLIEGWRNGYNGIK